MSPEIRAVVGKALSRDRAVALIESGAIDPGKCLLVWNVRDRPVTHPVSQAQIPPLSDLRPIRRIGTYKDAGSRIAMFAVMRAGRATMLELESQLELHHARQLSLDPSVGEILAQPFLMLWRHKEGSIVHVPDLAVTRGGRLSVYAVKPDVRQGDPWTEAIFNLITRSLHSAHIEFSVLGSITKQRQVNLARITRYRSASPVLADLLEVVRPHQPRTIGGVYALVARHLGVMDELRMPQADCPSLIGLDVAMYALSHGHAEVDLDARITWATRLTWASVAVAQ